MGNFRGPPRGAGAVTHACVTWQAFGKLRRRHHTQGFTPQPHIHGTGRGSQDHTIVVIGKTFSVVTPAVDGLLKTAHHGKTECRHTRGQPVHHRPGPGGGIHQRGAGRLVMQGILAGPVTRSKLGQAVEHGPRWPQAQHSQHRKPGQHPKHVAVCGQHGVFDDVAHHFAAGQLTRIHLLPLRQKLTGMHLITLVQRITDAGEMVAELAKTEGCVQDGHTPQHGQRPACNPHQQPVHTQHQQGRQQHRQAPHHPPMV